MNVSEMENIIIQEVRKSGKITEEAIAMLSSEDLNHYINVFKKKKCIRKRFCLARESGEYLIFNSFEIENRSSQSVFLDL